MLPRFLTDAGSFANDIDGLFFLILYSVGFWFIIAEVVLFYLIFRFSRRDRVKAQYITGESWREKRWVSLPHYAILVFDVLIIIAAVRVWVNVKQTMPPADAIVRVTAQQWAWSFVHPGPDGKLDTADDIHTIDELHVERNKLYHFELLSKDVVHSFSVPAFRLKQDALPGRVIKGWFKPTLTGTFDIQCAEMCGLGHALMPARISIENPGEHAEWIRAHLPLALATPPAAATPAPASPPAVVPPSTPAPDKSNAPAQPGKSGGSR